MEQHPVPQNVTTFQFRLIGDMTLKQFGYLAAGAMMGYLCYKLPLPNIFTLPLAAGAVLFGFGLAFVPVEERPMDIWVLSFIKSIYSPTLYVWQREKPQVEPAVPPAQIQTPATPPVVLKQTVKSVPVQVSTQAPMVHPIPVLSKTNPLAQKPMPVQAPASQPATVQPPPFTPPVRLVSTHNAKAGFLDWLVTLFQMKPKPATTPINPPPATKYPDVFAHMTTPSVVGTPIVQPKEGSGGASPLGSANVKKVDQPDQQLNKSVDEAEAKTRELEQKLTALQMELKQKVASEARILELQKQLTEVLSERQKMETELSALRVKVKKTLPTTQPASRPAGVIPSTPTSQPSVRVITADSAIKAGLPRLTTFPNVVTGIIKDHESNLLPGVLVTVRDKEDIPLRALKTNKLGQFAASTPLPNNTYYVEVEDPRNRYVFDRIQITLNGGVVPAIEVVAKSQKELSREKLAKEIFGNQPM